MTRTSTGSIRAAAGILPLDGFHISRSLARASGRASSAVTADQRLRRRGQRLRRPGGDLDQPPHPAALPAAAPPGLCPQHRGLATATTWSAGSMASRWAAAFFGESMFSRRDRCLKDGAGLCGAPAAGRGVPAVRHAVPDAASGQPWRQWRSRVRTITAVWPTRLAAPASFDPAGLFALGRRRSASAAASGSTQDSTQTS